MTTLSYPLTLDDYRAQVVMQLKVCAEPARAAELVSDVDNMLDATQKSPSVQKAFWRDFSQDLDLLTQKATLLDPDAAATLRTVITTARAVAARALRRLPAPDPAAD